MEVIVRKSQRTRADSCTDSGEEPPLRARGSLGAVNKLVHEYSKEALPERLEQLYSGEISRVIGELYRLLPNYRSYVDGETYRRDRARLMLVSAYLCTDSLRVEGLKTSLKYLLRKRQEVADALQQDV